jgi:hypothetical protein
VSFHDAGAKAQECCGGDLVLHCCVVVVVVFVRIKPCGGVFRLWEKPVGMCTFGVRWG